MAVKPEVLLKSFKKYQFHRIPTSDGVPAHGDFIFVEVILRFSNGYLSDVIGEEKELLPAVEALDGKHFENWQDGVMKGEWNG